MTFKRNFLNRGFIHAEAGVYSIQMMVDLVSSTSFSHNHIKYLNDDMILLGTQFLETHRLSDMSTLVWALPEEDREDCFIPIGTFGLTKIAHEMHDRGYTNSLGQTVAGLAIKLASTEENLKSQKAQEVDAVTYYKHALENFKLGTFIAVLVMLGALALFIARPGS